MITSNYHGVTQFMSEFLNVDIPAPERASVIGWFVKGELTAGVLYERFTGTSVVASIANRPGKMLNRDFLWTIFDYPFNQLKVKKVILFVKETNDKSLSMIDKMGFVYQSRITEAFPDGDMLIYTIEKHQCRYLKEKYHGKRHQNT